MDKKLIALQHIFLSWPHVYDVYPHDDSNFI